MRSTGSPYPYGECHRLRRAARSSSQLRAWKAEGRTEITGPDLKPLRERTGMSRPWGKKMLDLAARDGVLDRDPRAGIPSGAPFLNGHSPLILSLGLHFRAVAVLTTAAAFSPANGGAVVVTGHWETDLAVGVRGT